MWRALALCFVCQPALSQNVVDDLVGEGVFGVKWTDSFDTVRAAYPNGKASEIGAVEYWQVPDERTIFEVEREAGNYIRFGFLGAIFSGVTVTFPDCIVAATGLAKYLGSWTVTEQRLDSAAALAGIALPVVIGRWRGTSIQVELVGVGGECMMNIGPWQTVPVPATRGQLGLE